MKKYLILVLIVLLIGALFVGVLAAPAGKSNVGHLYLYEKDPTDWSCVEGGAWGKMKYNLSGEEFEFVFNGHGLVPGEEYCLIYYVDCPVGWPGGPPDIFCLGRGEANAGGEVHIAGSVTPGSLPWDDDLNDDGAKIWLVPCNYVDCESGAWVGGWSPADYLFEGELITFTQE